MGSLELQVLTDAAKDTVLATANHRAKQGMRKAREVWGEATSPFSKSIVLWLARLVRRSRKNEIRSGYKIFDRINKKNDSQLNTSDVLALKIFLPDE